VAVVISLNRFLAPVDDTVTAHSKTQVTSHSNKHTRPRLQATIPVGGGGAAASLMTNKVLREECAG
jgi:hypothetical protein